ncbi:haloacid dehalogenase type II [Conexibacter sp. DBS9H8]|uniref:haloacid dehalogenase type II n=1 Tax=Conexibacter sp. DBS9H8 TaxID=2937801 RepID=UPI00200F05CB|nr:haloacid dehalogenase type II [Conexibacter sp. DBS9H8]
MTASGPRATPVRPQAVVFDVNETLTDLSALRSLFTGLGLGEPALPWWFAVLLRDGMALAAAGDSGRFPDLAAAALEEVCAACGQGVPTGAIEKLLRAFAEVPVHADVAPALERLAQAGVPAVALTNGGLPGAERILERAGVRSHFAEVLSVDAVGHWKPRPEPYHHAARVAGVPPRRLAMVAVHPWDLHGAAAAGLVTGWVRRGRGPYPPVFTPPTVEASGLDGVVEALLDL